MCQEHHATDIARILYALRLARKLVKEDAPQISADDFQTCGGHLSKAGITKKFSGYRQYVLAIRALRRIIENDETISKKDLKLTKNVLEDDATWNMSDDEDIDVYDAMTDDDDVYDAMTDDDDEEEEEQEEGGEEEEEGEEKNEEAESDKEEHSDKDDDEYEEDEEDEEEDEENSDSSDEGSESEGSAAD